MSKKSKAADREPLSLLHYKDSELVFGVVAAVGTDLDAFESLLSDLLIRFGYKTATTRLSAFLDRAASVQALETTLDSSSEFARIKSHMDAGNELRERYDQGDVLALLAVSDILRRRGFDATRDSDEQPQPLRSTVHLLRSLKHPDEVQALRRIYGPGVFLIALHSHEEDRLEYLDRKGLTAGQAKELIDRDQDEKLPFGQRTRDTFQLADVFIRVGANLKKDLGRFLNIVFGDPHVTPTRDEHAMFLAYAASLRSADLSRQVGAVVLSEAGETIATGANDVPTFDGGLYWSDSPADCRDYKRGYDSNSTEIARIARDTVQRLGVIGPLDDDAEIARRLSDSRLYDLTEFGRAVHAEMEALICCARVGVSPRKGTLYTTTFPCHNCAKHIVGAGIQRVVYVEPYPKSLALELHDDSIELEPRTGASPGPQTKVRFSPFVGVAARRYFDLFSTRLSTGGAVPRKDRATGKALAWKPEGASPRVFMASVSYLEREVLAVRELFSLPEGRKK